MLRLIVFSETRCCRRCCELFISEKSFPRSAVCISMSETTAGSRWSAVVWARLATRPGYLSSFGSKVQPHPSLTLPAHQPLVHKREEPQKTSEKQEKNSEKQEKPQKSRGKKRKSHSNVVWLHLPLHSPCPPETCPHKNHHIVHF